MTVISQHELITDDAIHPHSKILSDTSDNTAATVTVAAPASPRNHYITSIAGSYDSNAKGKALILKEGGVEIARWIVPDENTIHIEFPSPIIASGSLTLELEASGTGGTSGTCVLTYFTI